MTTNALADKATEAELSAAAREFDHHGSFYRSHSTELLSHMQTTCPFAHTSKHGGFWVATKADTVLEVSRNADVFSNFPAEVIPALEPTLMIPINSDPPELYDYRAILNPLFSPGKMKLEAPLIRADADMFMDEIVARGQGDFVLEMAQPLSGVALMRLLGVETSEWSHYAYPLHELIYSGAPIQERLVSMGVMLDRMRAEIRRQQHEPKGGIIEYLHNVEMTGRKLRLDEIDSIVLIMLGGGLDTGQALLGQAAVYLGRNPDRRQELIDRPEIMESAIEEFLRIFPPTQGTARRVKQDIVVAGNALKAEEWVFMSYAAANRDPAEFPEPNKVDFSRENNRHYSFGVGPHRCLGSHLARLELVAGLESLLKKAPNYRIVEEKLEMAQDVGTVYGYNTVPIIV